MFQSLRGSGVRKRLQVREAKGDRHFYNHFVGVIEEDPITTIVMPHRRQVLKEIMVVSGIYAPLAIPSIGAIKTEDTFLITSSTPEQLTEFHKENF